MDGAGGVEKGGLSGETDDKHFGMSMSVLGFLKRQERYTEEGAAMGCTCRTSAPDAHVLVHFSTFPQQQMRSDVALLRCA